MAWPTRGRSGTGPSGPHPVLGELFPDSFIPMAESTSLIDLLMRRVLDLALSQVARWDD